MSENEVYERESEGITFTKVGYFFKVGWLRMLIYLLVAVVVTAIVALPIRMIYKSEPVGTFSIEYIYDGVEKGKDPNGGMLDVDNIISTTVLRNAVSAAGLSDIISDIATLRGAMRVEGVDSEEYKELKQAAANGNEQAIAQLASYNIHHTRFDVILSEPSKLGLSDTQTVQLLDKIYTAYCADFRKRFSLELSVAVNFKLSENTQIEYTDIYDEYMQAFDTIDSYLVKASAKSYNSDAFTVLRNEIAQVELSLGVFNNHITANNIWIDRDLAKSALTESEAELTEKSKTLQDEYDAIHKIVESMRGTKVESSPTLGTTVTTTVYPDNYEEYVQLELNKLEQIRKVKDKLATVQARLKRIEATEDSANVDTEKANKAKEEALRQLKAIESTAAALVEKIRDEITDYSHSQYVAQSVSRVRPSAVTRKTIDFNIWIVFGCTALLGLLIGGIVTGVKISKNKGAAKEKEQAPAAQETTEAESK